MAKPIGYYTDCRQSQTLTLLFGEDLSRLPQIDQAALLVMLSQFIYQFEAYSDHADIRFLNCVEDAIQPHNDQTTDNINAAIACLDNISKEEAIGIIQFLVQS